MRIFCALLLLLAANSALCFHFDNEKLKAIGEKQLNEYRTSDGKYMAFRMFRYAVRTSELLMFRVIIDDGENKPYIQVKKVNTKSGKIILDKEVRLRESQVHNILNFIEKANYWNLPKELDNDEIIDDGSSWTLEGISDDIYHVTVRDIRLPPYYSFKWDYDNKKTVPYLVKPYEEYTKHSDEVGLDMLCIIITLLGDIDEFIN